jgi:hypothetical protein
MIQVVSLFSGPGPTSISARTQLRNQRNPRMSRARMARLKKKSPADIEP